MERLETAAAAHEDGVPGAGRTSPTSVAAPDFGSPVAGAAVDAAAEAGQAEQTKGPAGPVPPSVLRLDCSKDNSRAVVDEWLAQIDGFIAGLA